MDELNMKRAREEVKDLIEKVKANDLPEPYSTISMLIGLEETLMIAKELGGARYYFPKFESLFRENRNTMIYDEFSGNNYKEIAKKYNLSETRIREIIQEEHDRRYMQLNMFGNLGK